MMLRHCLILSFALCAVLSGCAARESAVPAASVPEAAPGSTQYFAESPFGQATLDAGPLYLSGLGNECRLIRVTCGTASYQLTLCKENGTWRFIPSIFEGMPQ